MLQANKRSFSIKVYKNFINGKWVDSKATSHIDVICPLTQNVLAKIPQSTKAEFDEAVACSKEAFKSWKKVPISTRVRYMLKYQDLLKKNQDDICKMITKEHGKSLIDAAGDIFRGYEVVEHSCSFTSLIQGETV